MLLTRIDRHLRRSGMSPTRFGRNAVSDPNLVQQLRAGRELRPRTAQRIVNHLKNQGDPE